MIHDAQPQDGAAPRARRIGRRVPLIAGIAALSGLAALGGSVALQRSRPAQTQAPATVAALEQDIVVAAVQRPDPLPVVGPEAQALWRSALLGSLTTGSDESGFEALAPAVIPEAVQPPETPAPVEVDRFVQTVPLPVARPPEFRRPSAIELPRRATRRAQVAAAPVVAEDDRSFMEKLFGIERPATPALAYAALGGNAIEANPRRPLAPMPNPGAASGGIAVYDISARIVTLPNGEKLEAHSGLGEAMDDPGNVHVKMRGATPPGTYDLTEREQLFHGVRAIRLSPVGGAASVYNRAGLLAHTYMLGASGASNGCVSFRDYNRFLQAYLRGEIGRLVVVTGRGQDALPRLAAKPAAAPIRSASAADDSWFAPTTR